MATGHASPRHGRTAYSRPRARPPLEAARRPSSAPRRWAPRSPPRGCSRRGSGRRRSCGRTRSPPCSWRCRPATGSAAGSPTATRRSAGLCRVVLVAARAAGAGAVRRRSRSCASRSRRWTRVAGGRVRRLADRRARARRRAGAAARRGRALRGAPERADGRGGRARRRPPVRDLDRWARWSGTFLSALLLIPLVGTRRTFLTFALALAVVAVPALRAPLRARARSALALLLVLPVGTVKASRRRQGDLGARDRSTSTRAWSQDPDGERRLELNEGQAVHSVYRPGRWLTGDYWDEMLVLPFAGAPAPRRARSRSSATRRARPRARYGHYFPRDARRRRRDRPRADRRRPPLVRPARPAPAPAHRRRAPVPAPVDAALRRRSSSTPTASPTSRST